MCDARWSQAHAWRAPSPLCSGQRGAFLRTVVDLESIEADCGRISSPRGDVLLRAVERARDGRLAAATRQLSAPELAPALSHGRTVPDLSAQRYRRGSDLREPIRVIFWDSLRHGGGRSPCVNDLVRIKDLVTIAKHGRMHRLTHR